MAGAFLFFLAIAIVWMTERADRAANFAFGEKARANHIEGQSEDAVRRLFGVPDYVNRDTHPSTGKRYHTLVFTPGPRFCLWNSQCMITIDGASNTVTAWVMNSD
jgi:hypothetical protein